MLVNAVVVLNFALEFFLYRYAAEVLVEATEADLKSIQHSRGWELTRFLFFFSRQIIFITLDVVQCPPRHARATEVPSLCPGFAPFLPMPGFNTKLTVTANAQHVPITGR